MEYDIQRETIAYSILSLLQVTEADPSEIIDVTGKSLKSLLYGKPKNIEDIDQTALYVYPSVLRVRQNGKDRALSLQIEGVLLKLYQPVFSLSPRGDAIVAVAPVHHIPSHWEHYKPSYPSEDLYLRQENSHVTDDANPWKASEFVMINLRSGSVTPLLQAPAGRGLSYSTLTKASWSPDGRFVIVSNTFLPVDSDLQQQPLAAAYQAPVIAAVDTATMKPSDIAPVDPVAGSQGFSGVRPRLIDLQWSGNSAFKLFYASGSSSDLPEMCEAYEDRTGHWEKIMSCAAKEDRKLSVEQDLNHPPALVGYTSSGERRIVWNPNPQLGDMTTGEVSLYEWTDQTGYKWSGLLALPPHSTKTCPYPLVIQTHGYDAHRYFADGEFTTGSGGRALVAQGVAVLQMSMPSVKEDSPEDAPFFMGGFESAIKSLADRKLVDPRRVGVIGFSYTCFHVLFALTNRPDLFAAASITDGHDMSYMSYMMINDTGYEFVRTEIEETNGGKPFWQRAQAMA